MNVIATGLYKCFEKPRNTIGNTKSLKTYFGKKITEKQINFTHSEIRMQKVFNRTQLHHNRHQALVKISHRTIFVECMATCTCILMAMTHRAMAKHERLVKEYLRTMESGTNFDKMSVLNTVSEVCDCETLRLILELKPDKKLFKEAIRCALLSKKSDDSIHKMVEKLVDYGVLVKAKDLDIAKQKMFKASLQNYLRDVYAAQSEAASQACGTEPQLNTHGERFYAGKTGC